MHAFHLSLTALLPVIVFATGAAAQVPDTLLHSLFNPGTNAQTYVGQGSSVAIDGNTAVVGSPSDDVGAEGAGLVKVYNATSGALLHSLTNPSPAEYAYFGSAVAISGNLVVVGARYDSTDGNLAGRVHLYDLAGATPAKPVLTLTNPTSSDFDEFGFAVAISGNRVVIGAPFSDTGAIDAGSAYVYDIAGAAPSLPVATLTNPGPAQGEFFGYSVGISGTRVAIGAMGDNVGSELHTGSAYVYELAGATPTVPVFTLTNPSPAAYDAFGAAVSISGDRVVVGARFNDIQAVDAGGAYVFYLTGVNPTAPSLTLTNPSPSEGDGFGYAVGISGTRVVIGAAWGDTGATEAGSAYVYDLAGVAPGVPVATLQKPSPSTGDNFGSAVAISGHRVVVGAPVDGTVARSAGSAYTYDLAGAVPDAPVATLNAPSPASFDRFGYSVAVSGTRAVVGAPLDFTTAINAGRAYVYDLSSTGPPVPVVLDNPSPAEADRFGISVAISGNRVAVGAILDDTGAIDAGCVYVYDMTRVNPTVPFLTLTNPYPQAQDFFAISVAISGAHVAVGAPYKDNGAPDSGSAYVFDLSSVTPTQPVLTLTNPSARPDERFGWSVAISGSRIVVGADASDTGAQDAGSAYVFDLAHAMPAVPLMTLTNPSPTRFGEFGVSVSISGARVVVGANEHDIGALNAGSAYVYDLGSATPAHPFLTLTNPGPADYESFGNSVAISGALVVIGVPYDNATAPDAGCAYVYDVASATPDLPVATLRKSKPATRDNFGWVVAIDGTTIITGTPYDDANATDRGAAYVFGLRPTLNIAPAAPGFATISWTPTTSSGFELRYTESVATEQWFNAPSGPTNPVTVPVTTAPRFYRLFQP